MTEIGDCKIDSRITISCHPRRRHPLPATCSVLGKVIWILLGLCLTLARSMNASCSVRRNNGGGDDGIVD